MRLKSKRTFASPVSRTLIATVLGVLVGAQLHMRGADELVARKSGIISPVPVLPVVARPPAAQPPVGLPADTHLDKNPPRKTKSLDLVKNG